MSFLKKRSVAIVILAIVVVVSVLFGSHRSLAALRQDAQDVFTQGEKGDGLSIEHDLESRVQLSSNLVTVARRYLDADASSVTGAEQAAAALSAARTPGEKYRANAGLDSAFGTLYAQLGEKSLSEQDARYRTRIQTDFQSRNATISHDAYNRVAQNFNEGVLGSFPAGLLGAATGIQPLELYR